MRIALAAAAFIVLACCPAFADDSKYFKVKVDGSYESGWVVSFPTGSSDFFNTRFDVPAECDGQDVCAISISVADFGASVAYPRVGHYAANLAVDATGNTPDLNAPYSEVSNPTLALGNPLYTTECVDTPRFTLNTGDIVHKVVQLPPGDSGLLGVGADTDVSVLGGGESPGNPNPADSSGFTSNGYSTAAASFASGDFGLGCKIDCCTGDLPRLSFYSSGPSGEPNGDFSTFTTRAGESFGIGFWGRYFDPPGVCDLWLLFISFLGSPVQPALPSPLPSLPLDSDGDGTIDCCHIRIGAAWPSGAGGLTINFVAVAGAPGVLGSIAISNEVTLHSLDDPNTSFGVKDDCSFEGGWVVAIPAGSSDYFSTPWGTAPGALSQSSYAVMDFGTTVSAYPSSGQAPPNLAVDAAGNTPDLSSPYVSQPMPFAPLTFATTCNQMTVSGFSSYTPGGPVLEFIQFPVGDAGLLGIGADTNNTFIDGLAGWTLDGFSSAANLFGGGNWGMRTQ